MKIPSFPALALAALTLALTGCAGSLQQVQGISLQPGERAQFLAQADKTAADAGLRKKTPKPYEEEGMPPYHALICGFQWRATGRDSGMTVTWDPHGDWVGLEFPADGSLEKQAVSLADFARKNYGGKRLETWRPVPFVNMMLQDF